MSDLAKVVDKEEKLLTFLCIRYSKAKEGRMAIIREGLGPKERAKAKTLERLSETEAKKASMKVKDIRSVSSSLKESNNCKIPAKRTPNRFPIANEGMILPPEKWEVNEKKVRKSRTRSKREKAPSPSKRREVFSSMSFAPLPNDNGK